MPTNTVRPLVPALGQLVSDTARVTGAPVSTRFNIHRPSRQVSPLGGPDSPLGASGFIKMQDAARWARALYDGPLLADKQGRELSTVVSGKTGKPITAPSKEDPSAFGLGVGAGFRPMLGAYLYYQGMTLGYRVLYPYFPKNGAVIVLGLNSQPDDKQNHNGALLQEIYGLLQKVGKIE